MTERFAPTTRRRFLTVATALGSAAFAGIQAKAATAPHGPAGHTVGGSPSRGEFVVRGAYLITMDAALGLLTDADLHVRNGSIVAVGAKLKAPHAAEIDGRGLIALPGLIDTHWHMWNSLARGLVGDVASNGYFTTIQHFGPHYTPDDTYQGTRLALVEALASGITTVHNWAHNTRGPEHAEASLTAHDEIGLRARFGYGTPQGYPPDKLMDLADLGRLKRERFGGPKGLLTLGAALRGPQFGSMDACRREYEAVRALGLPISVHVTGNRTMSEKYNTIQTLGHDGLLGPDVQLIHAVHATQQDRELLAATGTHLSLSPLTELGAGMGFSQVAEMLGQGILVSLSVDTTALPTIADMFEIMRMASNLVHAKTEDSYKFTAYNALELATINGARDLGIDDQVGSLTPGKRADMILLRMTDVNMGTTTETYVNRVVKSARPVHVDTVVVDGKILKRHGRLVAVDADRVVREASAGVVSLRERAAKP